MFCHANFKSSGAENWIYIRLTGLIFSGAGKFLCLIMCIVISCTCLIYWYTHVNSELFWQFLCFTILYWQEQEMMYGMRWRTSLTLNDITCSNLKTSHNKIKKNKKSASQVLLHFYFQFPSWCQSCQTTLFCCQNLFSRFEKLLIEEPSQRETQSFVKFLNAQNTQSYIVSYSLQDCIEFSGIVFHV